jgi:hypothetical protein
MKCENCDDRLPFPSVARLWNEYRVGGPNSEERFHLCPTCQRLEVDPISLWAGKAQITEISE